MPDGLAARRLTCRLRDGDPGAAFTRRWRARALTGAALLAVCSVFHLGTAAIGVAHAAGAAANAPSQAGRPALPVPNMPAPPRASLPGFNPPPASPGTTASGPVRAQPARMPFYVATRGTTTIYVLGTLHVGDPADYPANQPFRAPILGALAASPTLALELSPDELLVSQDDVSKYGVCRRDCLPGLLPEPLWHKLAVRLRGNPAALDAIIAREFAVLRMLREREDARLLAWIAGLSEADLAGRFTYMTLSDMRRFSQRLAPALVHLFNHQAHHRGQVHMMLTVLGRPSLQLDLIAFQRTEEGREFA